jgi:hypothetical protein
MSYVGQLLLHSTRASKDEIMNAQGYSTWCKVTRKALTWKLLHPPPPSRQPYTRTSRPVAQSKSPEKMTKKRKKPSTKTRTKKTSNQRYTRNMQGVKRRESSSLVASGIRSQKCPVRSRIPRAPRKYSFQRVYNLFRMRTYNKRRGIGTAAFCSPPTRGDVRISLLHTVKDCVLTHPVAHGIILVLGHT